MANTTFSGPVRSENGFVIANKNTTTGNVTDSSVHSSANKDVRRYYLEEYWKRRPALNAVLNTAFSNAVLVTFVGSIMPFSIISTYSPVWIL